MGLPTPRFPEDTRELIRFPAFDFFVIALRGSNLRFVAAPVQPIPDQFSDMVRVIVNPEVSLDHLGDAGRSPQLVWVTVSGGPLTKESFQFVQLWVRQPAFRTRHWVGRQTV